MISCFLDVHNLWLCIHLPSSPEALVDHGEKFYDLDLHPTILSLPSINKQTLHLTVWMKPPSNTISFVQDSFVAHSI
jgi:hypothetical protein